MRTYLILFSLLFLISTHALNIDWHGGWNVTNIKASSGGDPKQCCFPNFFNIKRTDPTKTNSDYKIVATLDSKTEGCKGLSFVDSFIYHTVPHNNEIGFNKHFHNGLDINFFFLFNSGKAKSYIVKETLGKTQCSAVLKKYSFPASWVGHWYLTKPASQATDICCSPSHLDIKRNDDKRLVINGIWDEQNSECTKAGLSGDFQASVPNDIEFTADFPTAKGQEVNLHFTHDAMTNIHTLSTTLSGTHTCLSHMYWKGFQWEGFWNMSDVKAENPKDSSKCCIPKYMNVRIDVDKGYILSGELPIETQGCKDAGITVAEFMKEDAGPGKLTFNLGTDQKPFSLVLKENERLNPTVTETVNGVVCTGVTSSIKPEDLKLLQKNPSEGSLNGPLEGYLAVRPEPNQDVKCCFPAGVLISAIAKELVLQGQWDYTSSCREAGFAGQRWKAIGDIVISSNPWFQFDIKVADARSVKASLKFSEEKKLIGIQDNGLGLECLATIIDPSANKTKNNPAANTVSGNNPNAKEPDNGVRSPPVMVNKMKNAEKSPMKSNEGDKGKVNPIYYVVVGLIVVVVLTVVISWMCSRYRADKHSRLMDESPAKEIMMVTR